MGPASRGLMTPVARAAVSHADVLVGGKRHLAQFPDFAGEHHALDADIPGLMRWIADQEGRRVVVLASGDPLFYGIGKRLVAEFGIEKVRIIPGISAVQYLCSKTGIDLNDIWPTSSHGRAVDFAALVRSPKTAMVTDARCGPREIAAALEARRAGTRWVGIADSLAMEKVRIPWLKAH